MYIDGFANKAIVKLKLHNGNISDRFLEDIINLNPMFTDYVNKKVIRKKKSSSDYICNTFTNQNENIFID